MFAHKNRYDVWEHFHKMSSKKVQCKLCSKQLSVSGGVTSSMRGHMHSKHLSVVDQPLAEDSTPVMTTFLKQHACPDSRAEQLR